MPQEQLSRRKMTGALPEQPQAGWYSEPAASALEHLLPRSLPPPALDTSSPGHQSPKTWCKAPSHSCLLAPICTQLPEAEILARNTSLPGHSGLYKLGMKRELQKAWWLTVSFLFSNRRLRHWQSDVYIIFNDKG